MDDVVLRGRQTWALEVKCGRSGRFGGLREFRRRHPRAGARVVGRDGIPLDELPAEDPQRYLG